MVLSVLWFHKFSMGKELQSKLLSILPYCKALFSHETSNKIYF